MFIILTVLWKIKNMARIWRLFIFRVSDIFIFVRIFPDISNTLKKLRIFYSNSIDRDTQEKLFFEIKNIEWSYDIPGFITTKDLMDIIYLKVMLRYQCMDCHKFQNISLEPLQNLDNALENRLRKNL